MKSLFQILFLNLKNNKDSSFKLGQDITKKLRSSGKVVNVNGRDITFIYWGIKNEGKIKRKGKF